MDEVSEDFLAMIEAATTIDELTAAISRVTNELGFRHFALTHHVNGVTAGRDTVHLHNYPERWATYHQAHDLGVSDPVHRASHHTTTGFWWSDLAQLIVLTDDDRRLLAMANNHGLAEGFTISAHLPGETSGTCSFAISPSDQISRNVRYQAYLAGSYAFEAARRLWLSPKPSFVSVQLTHRQLDCLLWAARGKSDFETSLILGISRETVALHIRQACERYSVNKRAALIIRALFDHNLTFAAIFSRR